MPGRRGMHCGIHGTTCQARACQCCGVHRAFCRDWPFSLMTCSLNRVNGTNDFACTKAVGLGLAISAQAVFNLCSLHRSLTNATDLLRQTLSTHTRKATKSRVVAVTYASALRWRTVKLMDGLRKKSTHLPNMRWYLQFCAQHSCK